MLVFIGSVASGYDSYETASKAAVRNRYRRRAWLALIGFFLSLGSALTALIVRWFGLDWFVYASVVLLASALILASIAALQMVGDIK